MRYLLVLEELEHAIEIDSAGTGEWHVGEPPDGRAKAAAKRRGLDVRGRARQFEKGDFARYDYVVAMDRNNQRDLLRLAPDESGRSKVVLFRDFDPDGPRDADVPDPYYGGANGFEEVLDICDAASRGLLRHVRGRHEL